MASNMEHADATESEDMDYETVESDEEEEIEEIEEEIDEDDADFIQRLLRESGIIAAGDDESVQLDLSNLTSSKLTIALQMMSRYKSRLSNKKKEKKTRRRRRMKGPRKPYAVSAFSSFCSSSRPCC